jgi:hypothetical protein
MILVTISKGRKTKESEDYGIYEEECIQFNALEEAMCFVGNHYGSKRKMPVYLDRGEERPIQIGYCIRFKRKKDRFQDWVVFGHLEYFEISQAKKYDIPLSTRH